MAAETLEKNTNDVGTLILYIQYVRKLGRLSDQVNGKNTADKPLREYFSVTYLRIYKSLFCRQVALHPTLSKYSIILFFPDFVSYASDCCKNFSGGGGGV